MARRPQRTPRTARQSAPRDQDPSLPSLEYAASAGRWQIMNDTLGGTETMRAARQEHLPQHAGENDKRYEDRLNSAVFTNYVRLTLEFLVGKPFSKEVQFTKDSDEAIIEFKDDMNLQGDGLTTVTKDWFTRGMEKSLSYCLIDFPTVPQKPDGEKYTLAETQEMSLRPYWVIKSAEEVIAARKVRIRGKEEFVHVRYWANEVVYNGFEESIQQRIMVLDRGEDGVVTRTLWVKADKDWEKGASVVMDIDVIPLVEFRTNRENRPDLLDLAYLNITHWQSESDQRASLTAARFPILAGSGVDEDKVITLGPYNFLASADAQSKYYYVEHTGAALDAGQADLDSLEERMALYGAEMLKERPDRQTATSAILDTAQSMAPLQRIVFDFLSSIQTALDYTAKWLDKEPGSAAVEINTEFALSKEQGATIETLKELRKTGDISRESFLEALKELGALPDSFDIKADQTRLDGEAEAKVKRETDAAIAVAAAKPAPAGGPPKK